MELEGHPTQDIVEELGKRGASSFEGDSRGPRQARDKVKTVEVGLWLFLPRAAYNTGVDEEPELN